MKVHEVSGQCPFTWVVLGQYHKWMLYRARSLRTLIILWKRLLCSFTRNKSEWNQLGKDTFIFSDIKIMTTHDFLTSISYQLTVFQHDRPIVLPWLLASNDRLLMTRRDGEHLATRCGCFAATGGGSGGSGRGHDGTSVPTALGAVGAVDATHFGLS